MLRFVEFTRLQGIGFAVFGLRKIEENDMRMQLRCRVTVYRPGAVVLEFRRHPFAGCFCGKIPADARLDIPLQFIECNANAFSMCLPYAFISAHKGSQRHALRCRKRCIPSRAVLHRTYLPTVPVYVFPRCLMAHQLLATHRVLAFREPLEMFLAHFSAQSPLPGEPAVPFTAYLVALRVVVFSRVGKLLRVIRLGLARTQWIGDG